MVRVPQPRLPGRREARQEPNPSTPSESTQSERGPSHTALLWINFQNQRPRITNIVASLAAFGLLWTIAQALEIDIQGFFANLALTFFGAMFSLAVPTVVISLVLRRQIGRLLRIAGQAAAPNRGPILPFLTETLQQMEDSLRNLQGDGAILESYEVAAWVRRCFQTAQGSYFGTDSHVPSQYRELYADYLAAHAEYIKRTHHVKTFRTLVLDVERLRTDRSENPGDFEEFTRWHTVNQVQLNLLSPHDNTEAIKDLTHPESLRNTDIGFWEGDFVLLFNALPDNRAATPPQVRLRISFPGEDIYDYCSQYIKVIEHKMTNLLTELPIYSDELSHAWRRFCNPEKRLQQSSSLLHGVLERIPRSPEDIRVFDGACGIGIETVYLASNGYFVISNEIESSLRLAAKEYAAEHDSQIPDGSFTSIDWLHLDGAFAPNSFDVAFVLGNSLCHLETTDQVQRTLRNFYSLVRPGGYFICDERNFQDIISNWTYIQEDPWNNFRFNRRAEKIMYHGEQVLGAPVQRSGRRIIFEYREVTVSDDNVNPSKHCLGTLNMLAFPKGTLKGMIASGGFDNIETLSDLVPNGLRDDADWFTYIAQKPEAASAARPEAQDS